MKIADEFLKDNVSIEEFASEFESFCETLKENYIVLTYKQKMEEFLKCEIPSTLTRDEKVILKNIKNYTKIIRNGENNIQVENEDGSFACLCAFNHLFQFIKKRRKI